MTPVSQCRRPPSDLRPRWPIIAFALAFAICIVGSRVWFNTDIGRAVVPSVRSSDPQSRIWLTARTNLAGYTFVPEPVSDAVKETLGTTNIVSGTFVQRATSDERRASNQFSESGISSSSRLSSLDPERITIFLATWSAESKKPLLMLGHTPDICWASAGWKPVDLGQPRQVLIDLPLASRATSDERPAPDQPSGTGVHSGSRPSTLGTGRLVPESRPSLLDSRLSQIASTATLPFSCRAFESPDRNRRELAVWCTLIDGQPLAESMPSGRESVQTLFSDAHVRMSILDRLLRATRQRLPVRGEKQFVRYSMPMKGDWRMTLEQGKSSIPFHLQSRFANKTPI